jgi:hypothetical protein
MEKSKLKQYVVVPILSLLTAFFFLLFLYWYPKLRKRFLYKDCVLSKATHLFIFGTSKFYSLTHNLNGVLRQPPTLPKDS